MTEAEWLACTDPQKMLKFLRRKANDRRLRLFACGCCRQIWKDLTLKSVRQAVEIAESYADGTVADKELKQAHTKGVIACTGMLHRGTAKMLNDPAYAIKMCRMGLAVNTAHDAPFQIGQLDWLWKDNFLKSISPVLLRCVIGNPFRALPPKKGNQQWKDKLRAWLTPTVKRLAEAIYEDRAFSRMPDLADALEKAGCHDLDILVHCRQPGEHVRGCWVMDLVLGKE